MPTFTNQATLSFNGNTYVSNIITGELIDSLTIQKTAASAVYSDNQSIVYAITMVNNGATTLNNLTLNDDLGAYLFNGNTVTPLTVDPDSIKFFIDGILQPLNSIDITSFSPLVIDGITIPAGSNALLLYEGDPNAYAPLAAGSVIKNTATVSGYALQNMVSATETVPVLNSPVLGINKFMCPAVVADNSQLTYTFLIQNTGNESAVATDNIILTDTFEPRLSDISVSFNGTQWIEGIHYTYNGLTGEFSTLPGAITVPAATFIQDPATGTWSSTPGTSTLTVTGTI